MEGNPRLLKPPSSKLCGVLQINIFSNKSLVVLDVCWGEYSTSFPSDSSYAFSGNTLVNEDRSLASVPEVTYLFFFFVQYLLLIWIWKKDKHLFWRVLIVTNDQNWINTWEKVNFVNNQVQSENTVLHLFYVSIKFHVLNVVWTIDVFCLTTQIHKSILVANF